MMLAVHLLTVCRAGSFWELAASRTDDMGMYAVVTTIIRNWHFSGGVAPANFWGLPYAIAGFSKLLSIPELMMVTISAPASLTVCVLVHRLYGGWVAAAFIFINFEWTRLSVEGGAEPLFMCFLYASFRQHAPGGGALPHCWRRSARRSGLRGVIALLSFAAVLAWRRSYRQLAAITLIGLAIGVLYVVPLWIILGSPFGNFIGYRVDWGPSGWPLTYPFGALVSSFLAAFHSDTRWCRCLSSLWLGRWWRWWAAWHVAPSQSAEVLAMHQP